MDNLRIETELVENKKIPSITGFVGHYVHLKKSFVSDSFGHSG